VVEEWEAAITQAIPTCTRIVAPSVLPFVVDQSTSRVDTQAAQSFLDRGTPTRTHTPTLPLLPPPLTHML
jgi:hypothetical protein